MVSSLVAYYSFDDWSNLGKDSNPSATTYPLTSTIVGGTGGVPVKIFGHVLQNLLLDVRVHIPPGEFILDACAQARGCADEIHVLQILHMQSTFNIRL